MRCKTKEEMDLMDKFIWMQRAFFPHGCEEEPFMEIQPLLLSTSNENKNNAIHGLFLPGTYSFGVNFQHLHLPFSCEDQSLKDKYGAINFNCDKRFFVL